MEEEKKPIKIVKAKKSIDYKEFRSKIYPLKINQIDTNIIEIIRPDIIGCEIEGLAPYGSYAKIVIDKNKEIFDVWILDPYKEDPDFKIANALTFNKD